MSNINDLIMKELGMNEIPLGVAPKKFEQWAIINLFGHQKMGALVTEQAIGGVSFVRVDIPDTKKGKGYTRLLGSGAIYSIDFCTEEVARACAEYSSPEPVTSWELPRQTPRITSEHIDGDNDIPFDALEENDNV